MSGIGVSETMNDVFEELHTLVERMQDIKRRRDLLPECPDCPRCAAYQKEDELMHEYFQKMYESMEEQFRRKNKQIERLFDLNERLVDQNRKLWEIVGDTPTLTIN